MSGHLCLKWNNHSTAFLNSISKIQIKEKYCDSTIVCQGKYFPVHRVILSTCSDYFEEMFERISCPHPYIVFKDIEPEEMGLLLNYMYQGEVNVVQEKLPSLIKAAEALKIKGLAVPDDLPTSKESSGRKRSHQSDENSQSKRRNEEKRKRTSELNTESHKDNDPVNSVGSNAGADEDEPKIIKQEPLDSYEYVEATPITSDFSNAEEMSSNNPLPSVSEESGVVNKEDTEFHMEGEPFIKSEDNEPPPEESYDDQSSWANYEDSDMQNLNMPQTSQQDDMPESLRKNLEPQILMNLPDCIKITKVTENIISRKDPLTGLRFYQCPFCPYESYSGAGNVKKHVAYKHTGEKPFACPLCSKRFTEKYSMQRHHKTCSRKQGIELGGFPGLSRFGIDLGSQKQGCEFGTIPGGSHFRVDSGSQKQGCEFGTIPGGSHFRVDSGSPKQGCEFGTIPGGSHFKGDSELQYGPRYPPESDS